MSLHFPESTSPDFPFYKGQPIPLSRKGWMFILAAVALGFGALNLPLASGPWRLVPAVLFPLIPLLALRAMVGKQAWSAIFRPLARKDLALVLGVVLLNLLVTFAIGAMVSIWFGASSNPAFAALSHQSAAEGFVLLAASIPQLLGEELLTILPFLALLTWLTSHARQPRRRAIVLAWLLSALPFALAHLPTYQWNWVQCILVIGSARLVLSLAYLRSGNLLVSTLAHILNDWVLFGGAVMLGALVQVSS